MKLVNAQVRVYRSIDDSGIVDVDPQVTILVGQNESGKTAFLQSLHRALPAEPGAKSYNVVEDYPRKGLNEYEKRHATNPDPVCILTYQLADKDARYVNDKLGFDLIEAGFEFEVTHKYGGKLTISISVDDEPYLKHLISTLPFATDTKSKLQTATSLSSFIKILEDSDLNAEETGALEQLSKKFPTLWPNDRLGRFVWDILSDMRPRFLYFDDYQILPGKVNLPELKRRIDNPAILQDEDRTALSLLQMAGLDLDDVLQTKGYESIKARLESVSNSITDKIFDFWQQNQDLDVEFDIKADPADVPPYNQGDNLYIRIRNRRHRVTVPFNFRSKGFIWFFSFIVWFDSIKEQLGTDKDLVLLLDEPGLSLHALAQSDFLKYINQLSNEHQIIYTTHSPFMVPSDRLDQVRMVEDKDKVGTKVSSNISSSDPRTVFPLQASLGYTIAQNLFISKKNLLVEGPADLIYLRHFSSVLEQSGREALSSDITIIPCGGLDKVATFIALLGGNDLEFAVLHDYNKAPDPRIESLVRERILNSKRVLHYGMFRPGQAAGGNVKDSDVEDMMEPEFYLNLFNQAYSKELRNTPISVSDLPPRDRILKQIETVIEQRGLKLRASGGFNHYLPANYLLSHPVEAGQVDGTSIDAFEILFKRVNSLLS